uniref:Uncharacterized protein n=1 Tax=Steinernema glaseri TaxID=37863 RepID=A0A1I7Z5J3_9BILA
MLPHSPGDHSGSHFPECRQLRRSPAGAFLGRRMGRQTDPPALEGDGELESATAGVVLGRHSHVESESGGAERTSEDTLRRRPNRMSSPG